MIYAFEAMDVEVMLGIKDGPAAGLVVASINNFEAAVREDERDKVKQ
jgi:hypothetical protein